MVLVNKSHTNCWSNETPSSSGPCSGENPLGETSVPSGSAFRSSIQNSHSSLKIG